MIPIRKHIVWPRFLELGGLVYSSLRSGKQRLLYMDSLSNILKATILLGVMKDDQLLYIDKREMDSIIRVTSHIGLKRPLTSACSE